MLLELVSLLALSVGAAVPPEVDAALAAPARAWAAFQASSPASFHPEERVVSNWRLEAARRLDTPPQSLAKLVASDSPATPRCIKLNNYWCVKRAGWAGEIAADAEGHVAFASALEGAMVAVMLLRRYYLVYDRRSAQAIVSRWAPAQCGAFAARRGVDARRFPASRQPRHAWHRQHLAGALARIASARIRNAANGAEAGPRRREAAPIHHRRSPAQDDGGAGDRGRHGRAARGADPFDDRRAGGDADVRDAAPTPGFTCADDGARIRQYALRAVEGVGAGPDDDLQLFGADGAPGANLPLVMQNMAKVEIGPFGARGDLIAAAIEAEARQDKARRSGGSVTRRRNSPETPNKRLACQSA